MKLEIKDKILAVSLKIAEGENREIVDRIGRKVEDEPGIVLLDLRTRSEYNYTIIRFAGEYRLLIKVLDSISKLIFKLIDFSKVKSSLKTVGSLSSIVFSPIRNLSEKETEELFKKYVQNFADKFEQSVFIIGPGSQQKNPGFKSEIFSLLPHIIKNKMDAGDLVPDFGRKSYNKKRGITFFGLQKYIVSLLFHLDLSDLDIAQEIADEVSKQGRILHNKKGKILKAENGMPLRHKGRFSTVSAVSGTFTSEKMVQILCNLMDYTNPTPLQLYQTIREVADAFIVEVPGSSILDYLPFDVVETTLASSQSAKQTNDLSVEDQLEIFSKMLNLNEFGEFNPRRQIIDFKFLPSKQS